MDRATAIAIFHYPVPETAVEWKSMNDRQAEFISQEVDRLMDEANGDGWLALRLAVIERLALGSHVSNGLVRVAPVAQPRRPPKPKAPSIDDPLPEEATPS